MAWFCYLTTSPVKEKYKRHLHFIMYIAIAWTSSDAIDRLRFDTRAVTVSDLVVTIIAVMIGLNQFYLKINVNTIRTLFTGFKRD